MIHGPCHPKTVPERIFFYLIDAYVRFEDSVSRYWPDRGARHTVSGRWIIAGAIITVLFMILFCQSCSPTIQGVCRHDALYTASVYAEQYPVRVWMGSPGHAQAQAFVEGEWKWLERNGRDVVIGRQDDFSPEWTATLPEYIEIMKGNYPWK